jgi:murein L,D-transpeptidase YcbB/YkuD
MRGFVRLLLLCSVALTGAIGLGVCAASADPAASGEPAAAAKAADAPSIAAAPPPDAAPPAAASGTLEGGVASAAVGAPTAASSVAGVAPSAAPESPEPAIAPPLPADEWTAPPLAAPSKLQQPLAAALTALVAEDVKTSPIGAGDWRAARQAIQAFYTARDFAPVWVGDQGLDPAAVSALSRLARAGEDGLDLSAFSLPKAPLSEASPERLAEAEATISAAVVAYAMQASGARLVPARISPLISAEPSVADPGKALAAIAAAADPDAALAAFNPQQKGYVELRGQLTRLRAGAPIAPPPIPAGPSLGIGMADPRVPLVRARLGLGADENAPNALVYDARLASAVAAFQRANGLPANGALTPATVEALSRSPSNQRQAMILANMEMWRWEPRAMGEERVEINIPDYSLRVMNGDDLVHRARVIVGKPDTPTPIFSNEIRYLLVNPIWRVPDSIIKKEMEPRLAQDPDYLSRHGYEVSQIGNRLVVRQPPGAGNALGRILFMFPNQYSVYLHDTPTRGLFAAARRAFSHGCVRVEEPMQLAELVMGGAGAGWTMPRLQSLLGATERTVSLPRAIPIHLEYFTEFVDDSGALQDREDIYGITRRVAGTFVHTSQD